ncbi:tetratricopeptide repeat protein [Streptomyces sp. NPDC127110]|uniref:tetratricopeptide repeat protein n=1 Tax=Streptomyces sp. NPDC127110 TaxID=3345362 RepID=UPI0036438366
MTAEQHARASGNARIEQRITYAAGAGPAPRGGLGLPEAPPVLVGRDGPAEELMALLADGGPKVAVVSGLAGVGKSALAVATAHRAAELGWFGDRVFFLRLRGYAPGGGVSGPELVREMLRLLGFRDADVQGSTDTWVALYRARLAEYARAGQRVLIVADDAGEVAQVRDLVPAGSVHRLLITSRHRLVAPGFTARQVLLDELAAGPAALLLSAALPGDPRPLREPEALAAVAERCGRLPLALTVAGAVLAGDPGLSVAELAAQLADARTRLAKLDSELDDGVRAAFDLSYERLPPDQARVFRLLTVNPGPDCATVYAALLTGEESADLRPKLAALVRASLLAEEPVGSGRWRMHDLVRLYARERGEKRAAEDGREAAVDALLGSLCLDTGKATRALGVNGAPVAPGPGLPSVAQAMRWLDAERATLVAAVCSAADAGRLDTVIGLGKLLVPYLQYYEHLSDGIVVARRVLAAAQRTGGGEGIGDALYDLALVLFRAYRPEEARELLARALDVFRSGGRRQGECKVLHLLGSLFRQAHRLAEAEAYLGEALAIFGELGIKHGQGIVLVGLAQVFEKTGRLDAAIDAYQRAVAVMYELKDHHRAAEGLDFLADALWRAGQREESLAVAERALALFRDLDNRKKQAWVLSGLAGCLLEAGREQEAKERFEEALALFAKGGDPHGQGVVLANLGRLHCLAGRPALALEFQERACVLLAGTGDRAGEAAAMRGLGVTLSDLGRYTEAAEAFDRSAGLFAAAGDTERESDARTAADGARERADRPRRRWRRR